MTQYETDRLFLIGARERENGRHYTRKELDELSVHLKVERPKIFSLKESGIKTLKQAKAFVEQESLKSGYGKVWHFFQMVFMLFLES